VKSVVIPAGNEPKSPAPRKTKKYLRDLIFGLASSLYEL
jgi:hypothetical protein